jgi:5,10-methylenetetrahydrofolate reductase
MELKAKIENPAQPVILYELIPPKLGAADELQQNLALIRELVGSVDAINIPEIREETRQGVRRSNLPERIEPRVFAKAIQDGPGVDTIINRVTVHEPAVEQLHWLAESYRDYAIRNLILVGGESHLASYAGPSVPETAALAHSASLDLFLGGISIPSRSQEAARIRKKYDQGLRFFTTQVLFDSNDVVDLIQGLNGLDVRIFLSFAPISNARDVEFLRWLGVDVPKNVSWALAQVADSDKAVEKSIGLASKILTDIFDNMPPHPPGLGINIEQITRRNHKPARLMLETLGGFYRHLLQARYNSVGLQELEKL